MVVFLKNMKKNIIYVLALAVILFGFASIASARSGCCSHHGGVCGCGCCDGTSLSATCAPYYPSCNTSYKPYTTYIAPVVQKPKVNVNSDAYIDANYYNVCSLKSSIDKHLYRYKGQNYYDSQCLLSVDPATEKFVVDNSLANTTANIHYWAYILLKYKNNIK